MNVKCSVVVPIFETRFFKEAPYFSNRYGYEEIPPSLYVVDAGCKNVFCSAIRIIHNPKVNKWNCSDEKIIRYL